MDYALIACFEPTGDYKVRRLMRQLAENNVNDLYESLGFRPHITLTEFSTTDFKAVSAELARLSQHLAPVDIRFSSLGIFPGLNGVFHLVPTINENLLHLQRQVRSALGPLCEDFAPLYEEPEWVPHCTLVLEMDPLELPRAYDVMLEHFKPFNTRLVALEIITCCPFRVEQQCTMGQPASVVV